MKVVKTKLGEGICDSILFLHAIMGYDTTSRLYEIGKGTAIRKYDTCQHFREQAKLFHSSSMWMKLLPQERMRWYPCTTASQETDSIVYDTGYTARNWRTRSHRYNPTIFPQLQLRPSITAWGSTYKCNSGNVRTQLCQWKIGHGRLAAMTRYCEL